MPLDPDQPLGLISTPLGSFIVAPSPAAANDHVETGPDDREDLPPAPPDPAVLVDPPRSMEASTPPEDRQPPYQRLRAWVHRRNRTPRTELQHEVSGLLSDVDRQFQTLFGDLQRDFAERSAARKGASTNAQVLKGEGKNQQSDN